MSYRIDTAYCWYLDGSMIVKMYFINHVPFTFDELPDGHLQDQDLCREADKNRSFEPEDLYKSVNTRYTQRALARTTGGIHIDKKLIGELRGMQEYGNPD